MTFLAPAAGLIAGAIAGPVLLALYLLKLRRRPAIVSSTLLWERAVHDLQVNAPFRWLRVTLLLIIQALALACLVIAVARPAITDAGPAPQRVFVVIDRSASMLALDGQPRAPGEQATRLDEAKRRAVELVDRLGRDTESQVALVSFGARARLDVGLTRDIGTVKDAINALEGADQPGDLAGAARLVNALQSDARGAGGGGEDSDARAGVVVFSDAGFDPSLVVEGITGAETSFTRVGDQAKVRSEGNLGLVALSARRDWEDPSLVRVFVRIQNSGAETRTTRLSIELAGETVGEASVGVPGATEQQPGELARTFEVSTTGGGLLVVRMQGQDLLASDDAVAMALEPAASARVLLVAPGPGDGRPDPFLLSVLEVLDLARIRKVSPFTYERMAEEPATGSGASAGDYDLVIFDRAEPRQAPSPPSLSFGRTVPGVPVQIEAASESSGAAARALSWRRTHPLMRYVALDALLVDPAPTVTLESRDVESLAIGQRSPLIVSGTFAGVRRVIVGFELANSNWGPDYTFVVFMSNVLEQLALGGDAEPGRWYRTDEPVRARAASGARAITIDGPISGNVPIGNDDSSEVSLGLLARAGVYTLAGAQEPTTVCVNLADPLESSLVVRDRVRIGSADAVAGEGGPAPREVWRWFVLAGACLAMVEWLLYAWRMRS